MLSINTNPGRFIGLAAIVVYGVILVEIWMWGAASVLAVAGTLLLIAVTAVAICRAALGLLDDEDGSVAAALEAHVEGEVVDVPAPTRRTTRPARPVVRPVH